MNRTNFLLAFDIHRECVLENSFEKYQTDIYKNQALFSMYIEHMQVIIDRYGYDILL